MKHEPKYTLVQHSAYVGRGDSDFMKAVEMQSVDPKQVGIVAKAGGLIFNTYSEARDAEFATNYPPGTEGLIPRATGRFAKSRIDGAAIYLPAVAS